MTASWRGELVDGRYELEERIGGGAFGEVWQAGDTHFRSKAVAIKILVPPWPGDAIPAEDRKRFEREAHLTAEFNGRHHIVLVTDVGEHLERPYLVMSLLRGLDLEELLEQGALPPARAVEIVEQIGEALTATHGVDLVHRDVKPSNVFVEQSGEVTLLDFGMVGALRAGALSDITDRGLFTGTVMYMGPERLPDENGAEAVAPSSAAGDLYSLACILHQCLTGHAPFQGNNFELWCKHRAADRPRPGAVDADLREFDPVVTRGLARAPRDRPESVAAFVAEATKALGTWQDRKAAEGNDQGAYTPPVRHALVGGVAVGTLGVGATVLAGTPPVVGALAIAASWASGACLGWWFGSRSPETVRSGRSRTRGSTRGTT